MANEVEYIATAQEQPEQVRGRPEEQSRKQSKRDKSKAPASSNIDAMEIRFAAIEREMANLRSTIGEISNQFDDLSKENDAVSESARNLINDLRISVWEKVGGIEAKYGEEVRMLRDQYEREIRTLRAEFQDLQRQFRNHHCPDSPNGASTSSVPHQVPTKLLQKPENFNGSRNAATVENFLFSVEQYLRGLAITNDEVKIATAQSFLRDTAQQWFRRRCLDAEKGGQGIETWEQFKAELRKKFSPSNANKEALRKFWRVRQTGSIADYVKEFTDLLLEVEGMPDNEILVRFEDGLRDYARAEVSRGKPQTLDEAIAIVENMDDLFARKSNKDREDNERGHSKDHGHKEETSSKPHVGRHKGPTEFTRPKQPPRPCFTCGGPHWTRDCPKRQQQVSALQANHDKGSQEEGEVYECISTMQVINSLLTQPKKELGGLCYADIVINGKHVEALVDTGASNSCIDTKEANRLGLRVYPFEGIAKGVNDSAKPIDGIAKKVPIKMGPWSGKQDFIVMPIDNEKVLIGLDFFTETDATPVTSRNTLIIEEGNKVYKIPLKRQVRKYPTLTSVQILPKKEVKGKIHPKPKERVGDQPRSDSKEKEKTNRRHDNAPLATRASRIRVGENVTPRQSYPATQGSSRAKEGIRGAYHKGKGTKAHDEANLSRLFQNITRLSRDVEDIKRALIHGKMKSRHDLSEKWAHRPNQVAKWVKNGIQPAKNGPARESVAKSPK